MQTLARTTLILTAAISMSATIQAAPQRPLDIDSPFKPWASAATPGCAVGVEHDGQTVLRAYGMADLEHDVPNASTTIFEAGSVSKQFTAAAILLLAQDGRIRLDDDIRKYLPEVPDYGKTITIDHLLTHTSGLRDWGFLTEIEGWPRTTRAMTMDDVLAMIARQRELNHAPGAAYSYTNSGYNLLAIIVERVSKQSLDAFSKERIFVPLGMNSTSWRDHFRRIVKGRAIAYAKDVDGYIQRMPFEDVVGNGGLLTTVGDLLIWNRALTDRKLGEFVATKFEERGTLNDGRRIIYARGLRVESRDGVREISHAGATGAYRAWLARFPDKKLSIAILCNAGDVGGHAGPLGYKIADQILSPPAAEASPIALPQLADHQGMFVDEQSGMPLTILLNGKQLRDSNGRVLTPISATQFKIGSDLLHFQGKDRLQIEGHDGNIRKLHRELPVTTASTEEYTGQYFSDEIGASYFAEERNGGLILRLDRRPGVIFPLFPSYGDAFLYDTRFGPRTAIAHFIRGTDGRVNGVKLGWNERVNGVRFDRLAVQP